MKAGMELDTGMLQALSQAQLLMPLQGKDEPSALQAMKDTARQSLQDSGFDMNTLSGPGQQPEEAIGSLVTNITSKPPTMGM